MEDSYGHRQNIVGSSIGGGKAIINKIDGIEVSIAGDYSTLITVHDDRPGIIADLSTRLSNVGINIAFMKLFREQKGEMAILVVEMDGELNRGLLEDLKGLEGIRRITYFNKMME